RINSSLRCRAFAGACAKFLTRAGQIDRSGITVEPAILRASAFDDHHIAYFQSRLCPALSRDDRRRTHFESPILDAAGLGILNIDVEVRMRILPIHSCNIARELHDLGAVIFCREGMMSEQRSSQGQT